MRPDVMTEMEKPDGRLTILSILMPDSLARACWIAAWRIARSGADLRVPLCQRAERMLAERSIYMTCRGCSCTIDHACPEGCSWVGYELCSACAPWPADAEVRDELRAEFRARQHWPDPVPPIRPEEDLTGVGVRVFKLDRWGRAVDSLLLTRFEDDEDEDDDYTF